MRRSGRPLATWRVELSAGYWFVTAAVALGGVVLAGIVLLLDDAAGRAGVFSALAMSPDAARSILGTIAGSLITIASLTASLTIVTLQLLSNQYTPRTVRGFLRRKVSQVVSGTFVGVFLYCLVLSLFVRAPGDENEPFVPSLGVVLSVILATGALLMLVLFINALARMIQVSTMVSEIAAATLEVIADRGTRTRSEPIEDPGSSVVEVRIDRVGWVRSTVPETLVERAPVGAAGRLRITVRPGDFMTPQTLAATWHPTDGTDWLGVRDAVAEAVLTGTERDLDDDSAFGVRQIADIALRALSPGINDPSTAVAAIHYLRRVFEAFAATPLLPLVSTRDDLTVVATERPFDELVDMLEEIAIYASSDLRVAEALVDALLASASVAAASGHEDRVTLLIAEAHATMKAARPDAHGARTAARLQALEATADRLSTDNRS